MKSNAVVKVETVHRLRAVDVHATAGGARGDVIERAVTRETTGDGRHVFGGLVLGERFSRGWVEDLDVALHGTAEDAVAGGGPDGAEREDPATGLVVVVCLLLFSFLVIFEVEQHFYIIY